MLRQLRSKKVAKRILIGLAIIIIPAFVLWGAGRSGRGGRGGRGPSYAGTIFGRKVSFKEYAEKWRAVRNEAMMRYEDFEKIYKQLRLEDEAWNRLILLHEAKKQKIKVGNQEVVGIIKSFSFLIRDNKFDSKLYEQIVTNTFRVTPREFEEDMRDTLKIQKLIKKVTKDVGVTEEELLEKYKEENEKIKIAYVTQSPRDFVEKVEISESEIGDYYETNSRKFNLPERVDIEYIEFKYTDYTAGIDIGEEEISYYYDYHLDKFEHPESIRARHILFDDEEKAKAVLKKLKRGADFEKMAKEHSTGPTRDRGGDLGYFERGKMAPEFEEAAFSLKAGKISDIVKTQFGYHIIKLEDRKEPYTEEFKQVKEKIRNTLLKESAKNKAYDEALLAAGSINNSVDFENAANEYGKTIKKTGYIPRYGMIPEIGWKPEIQKKAFDMKIGEVSPLIASDGAESDASYIIKLVEKKEPETPPLQEVRDRVEGELKRDRVLEMAKMSMEEYRETIMEKIESGLSFKKAAESAGLEVKESEYITRKDYIKDIGPAKDIVEAFDYEIGQLSSTISTDRLSCLIELTEFQPIEEEKFEEEKEEFREKILSQKKSQAINKWLADLKAKSNLKSNL